jgi:hypothetical protein
MAHAAKCCASEIISGEHYVHKVPRLYVLMLFRHCSVKAVQHSGFVMEPPVHETRIGPANLLFTSEMGRGGDLGDTLAKSDKLPVKYAYRMGGRPGTCFLLLRLGWRVAKLAKL